MPNMMGYTGKHEQDYEKRAQRPFYWYMDGELYLEAHTGPHAKKARAREELTEHRGLCPDCMQELENCYCP